MHLFTMPFSAPKNNHRSSSFRVHSWDQKICLQLNCWVLLVTFSKSRLYTFRFRGNKEKLQESKEISVTQITHHPDYLQRDTK